MDKKPRWDISWRRAGDRGQQEAQNRTNVASICRTVGRASMILRRYWGSFCKGFRSRYTVSKFLAPFSSSRSLQLSTRLSFICRAHTGMVTPTGTPKPGLAGRKAVMVLCHCYQGTTAAQASRSRTPCLQDPSSPGTSEMSFAVSHPRPHY